MPIEPSTIDALLQRTLARAAEMRRLPESTYRVQFHKGFTFRDAAAIVPYLSALGVTHLYASPYLKAVPGSTHGYDVIDHSMLNPEVGKREDFDALVEALTKHGMHQILDTVPNHMGVATNENVWWNDVLENGRASIYGAHFDIAWRDSPRASLHDRVLLPILGSAFGDVLEKGELKLGYADGAFFVDYYASRLPISPRTYGMILTHNITGLHLDDPTLQAFEDLISIAKTLPHSPSADRHQQKEMIKERLAEMVAGSERLQTFIANNVRAFNGSPGDPSSFDLLAALLDAQPYRLASWRTAPDEINYRRFFDVNDLAALSMDRPEVFDGAHAFTLQLLAEGKVSGLRIDHPDGLYDPAAYFKQLQQQYVLTLASSIYDGPDWESLKPQLLDRLQDDSMSLGEGSLRWPLYVLGEKILAMNEALPQSWALHGTSGYDFLVMLNGLFVDRSNESNFSGFYHAWTADPTTFDDLVYAKKRLILDRALSSELHLLAAQLDRLAQRDRRSQDFTVNGLREALREVIACFPVYRSYVTDAGPSDEDRRRIGQAIEHARRRNPAIEGSLLEFIEQTLLMTFGPPSEELRSEQRRFAGKFQQLTSPTTAKGVEDTTFYLYNRLLSLNEVGGEPSHFGIAPADLHRYLSHRQREWPYAMSTLSTHDTKRSEDVRARISVLSEMPGDWEQCVRRWSDLNAPHRTTVDGHAVPDHNEEYSLYQALLGAWPLPGEAEATSEVFRKRIEAYLTKAMREAKLHTTWTHVNEPHESAVQSFAAAILDRVKSGDFLQDFGRFQRHIAHVGLLNSLSQSLVKLTAPGVVDTYQGTELWDFSLVDPDNRRPVDFDKRRRLLEALPERPDVRALLESKEDGRIKLLLHREVLRLRREYPGLLTLGDYVPLSAAGPRGENVFAFARRYEGRTAVVIVGRLFVSIVEGLQDLPVGPRVWHDTFLDLPAPLGGRFRDLFTGRAVEATQSRIALGTALGDAPFALLIQD